MTPPNGLPNSTETTKLAEAWAQRLGSVGSWTDCSAQHFLYMFPLLRSPDVTAAYPEFLLHLTVVTRHFL